MLVAQDDEEEVLVELSEPVRAAVDEAVTMVESLVDELRGAMAMTAHKEGG